MDYKDSAKCQYRKLVSTMVGDLLRFPYNMSLTGVAVELHLTMGQMSRVYHGVCSLSPERFLVLNYLWCMHTGNYSQELLASYSKVCFQLPLHGID